ncbi:MAG TPA: TMEM175 family protein [Candidatus Omnitrophota bacterium]|nr:TMEM175 family protein [Candidatus Omnitrophota bacterium]HPD84822.1 TMEM175 family protein [Candidatus Omnitrophota bacterium]HRZ03680.1 TMEM175 family protein [Candidatus Omnitrophota bacterium]
MPKTRLEAFSDGVIAIIITIMVLELKVPHGTDFASLRPILPSFLSYILSFIVLGIYWNNHHHLLHAAKHINGKIMWANLHLLFWLSLVPFVTNWLGENHNESWPTFLYGIVFLMAAVAYVILQTLIVEKHGKDSLLAQALGSDWKGKLSLMSYVSALGLAFINHWFSVALYILVAILWLIPDQRIEKVIEKER